METKEIMNLMDSVWKEKVYIETAEFIIVGYIFMPKIGKRNRLLTEVLNSNKQFIAVKDSRLEFKLVPQKEIEYHDFLQVNISTILIMRPAYED
jgi:hypothetical protein